MCCPPLACRFLLRANHLISVSHTQGVGSRGVTTLEGLSIHFVSLPWADSDQESGVAQAWCVRIDSPVTTNSVLSIIDVSLATGEGVDHCRRVIQASCVTPSPTCPRIMCYPFERWQVVTKMKVLPKYMMSKERIK